MNPHYLSRIRYHGSTPYEFHCGCGHIAESLQDHDTHLAQVTP